MMSFFGKSRKKRIMRDRMTPLQVISPRLKSFLKIRKRTLLSASFSSLENRAEGSMTIEAALGLTMFLFLTVILMIPMRVMNSERQMQAALEAVGETIAKYAYVWYQAENGKEGCHMDNAEEAEFAKIFAGEAAKAYVVSQMEERVDSKCITELSASKSSVLEDGENVDLIVTYEVNLPFPVFRITSLKRQVRCVRRGWIGRDGYGNEGENGKNEEDKTIVYVGKDSSRYHVSRTCHYLYNDISAADYGEISSLRNISGKKYRACQKCVRGVKGGTVYYMPNGECYHTDSHCSSITSYVREAPLHEVEYLGPCSYCSGGKRG